MLNHASLQFQYDWRGASIQNTRMLVCSTCLDKPQQQLRALVVPADPVPIQNPRTQNYVAASTDYRITQGNSVDPVTGLPILGGNTRTTQAGDDRVTQQTGEPPGGLNIIPGSILTEVDYGDPGLPYGNDAIPKTGWLPGVNYIIWDNGALIQTGWYNENGELFTWLAVTG